MNETATKAITIVLLVLASMVLLLLYSAESKNEKRPETSISTIAKAGIFGGLASILYVVPIFTIKLPFFPEFLTLHFDEIPVLLIGLVEGPWCAFLTLLCKTLIKLPFSTTASVGEWADLFLSLFLILPVCFVYKKKSSKKGLLIGLSIALPTHLIAAMALNVFVLVPFYSSFYGIPLDSILALCKIANPSINNLEWGYALLAVLPFNLLKDAIVVALSIPLYKGLKFFMKKH